MTNNLTDQATPANTQSEAAGSLGTKDKKLRRGASGSLERFALLGALGVIIIIFGVAAPDTFLTTGNARAILGSQAVLLVLAMGLLFPLTTGDFDLSIAASLALSANLLAVLNAEQGWPLLPTMVVCLVVGLLTGILNGVIVVGLGVDSFIVTLGSSTLLLGTVSWISNSTSITGISQNLVDWTVIHSIFGVSMAFYYGLILTLAVWILFEFLPLGRRMLFVGLNRSVSRLSGIRVGHIRCFSFAASGTIGAAAGILYAGTLGGSDPASGASFLLPAFAACFLGTTSMYVGRFNPLGTFIAVYFLVTGITGLQLLGAENYVQNLFYGAALIVAVAFAQLARRRTGRMAES